MKNNKGFTLVELMLVISIIGILAAIAIPQFSLYRAKAFITEGKSLLNPIRRDVLDYLDHTGRFPKDNFQCGIAKPEFIKGKYVDNISVNNGVITVLFNDTQKSIKDHYIKLCPQINDANTTGPVVWDYKNGDLNEEKSNANSATVPTKKKRRKG